MRGMAEIRKRAGFRFFKCEECDIMSAKKKQATAKRAFAFLAPLSSKRPMISDEERDSASLRGLIFR